MNNLNTVVNVHTEQSVMPNLVRQHADEKYDSIKSDFIQHPAQYPLDIKKIRRWPWSAKSADYSSARIGLSIKSKDYYCAGSELEISIPLRGDSQSFIATVVLVRELREGFELGLWFDNREDEARARIVEKICETECCLGNATRIGIPSRNAKHDLREWVSLISRPRLGH